MLLTKRRWTTHTLCDDICGAKAPGGWATSITQDLVGRQVSVSQGRFFFAFGSYHRGGAKPDTLAAIRRHTFGGKFPFVLADDFNDHASSDLLVKWVSSVKARVVQAGSGEHTCLPSTGGHSCIDFFVVSLSLLPVFSAQVWKGFSSHTPP